MPSVVVRLSLQEQVRQAILDKIGAALLRPGNRIVEARLAEEFGISAISICEAMWNRRPHGW
jgi:DNA-binding GntR family transcriptional regulator